MSDDDETVIVMTKGRVYHTDETCYRITDRAREWDLDEALNDGRYECGHCQADENLDDTLPGVNAGVSSRWGYRLPTHGGNLRVRMLLVGD